MRLSIKVWGGAILTIILAGCGATALETPSPVAAATNIPTAQVDEQPTSVQNTPPKIVSEA